MSPMWDYFWPLLASGLLIGVVTGLVAFRRAERTRALIAGVALSLGLAALWHGPLGAADRFSSQVERMVRLSLDSWEMPTVAGHLDRAPLTRRVQLSGPADDFQRSELARIIETVPGVSKAGWTGTSHGIPLIGEAGAAAIVSFLFGLLLAYLVELHRRYNAQWNW